MRCTMCFQERTGMVQPFRANQAQVCKGCNREIERVQGWLEVQGVAIQLVQLRTGEVAEPLLADSPPTPPLS